MMRFWSTDSANGKLGCLQNHNPMLVGKYLIIHGIPSVRENFSLDNDAITWHHASMKRKHCRILELIFAHPLSANVKWRDIESLFCELGAEVTEREGSRVGVRLFGERKVFHRPHPSPDADKGAVASIRQWFEKNGVKP